MVVIIAMLWLNFVNDGWPIAFWGYCGGTPWEWYYRLNGPRWLNALAGAILALGALTGGTWFASQGYELKKLNSLQNEFALLGMFAGAVASFKYYQFARPEGIRVICIALCVAAVYPTVLSAFHWTGRILSRISPEKRGS